ncbi:MAG TPA: hypothetical protein VD995_08030 [Azospirillum sp.]|nr:hypothetical protein [Azospirillum sp.]
MVETRRTADWGNDAVRTDVGGGRVPPSGPPGGAGRVGGAGNRQKIPTVRQLASLVVNGILTLPRNYRRGMFLDVLA